MHFLSHIAFALSIVPIISGQSTDQLSSNRYEVCRTSADIQALQETYNLTIVSSSPTKAAMHPGWPETMISMFVLIISLYSLRNVDEESNGSWQDVLHTAVIAYAFVTSICWTISFASAERSKATGGWVSCLAPVTSLNAGWVAMRRGGNTDIGRFLGFVVFFLSIFQYIAAYVIMAQRNNGTVGNIAYLVTELNGCSPINGTTAYLEQGARTKAFSLIQSLEVTYTTIVFLFACCIVFGGGESDDCSAKTMNLNMAVWLFILYLPILLYEIVIAAKGTPVIISGNCMLVELDPNLGFLDSEIATWWKCLIGITGL